jgi:hypothetical protein
MQSFTPYFTGYENNPQQINTSQTQDRLQPQQQQPQQQQQRQQQEAQQQQQQTLNMNTSNLAVYPNPATMQPLSALAEAQKEMQNLQALEALGAHGKPKRKQVKNACGKYYLYY